MTKAWWSSWCWWPMMAVCLLLTHPPQAVAQLSLDDGTVAELPVELPEELEELPEELPVELGTEDGTIDGTVGDTAESDFTEELPADGLPADELPPDELPLDELPNDGYDDPEAVFDEEDTNPLNPAGDSLERLVRTQINADTWSVMLGDLPCLTASEACVRELQELAIANNYTLAEIDARVEAINERIEQARSNNQRSIRLGIFEPFFQDLVQLEAVNRVPNLSAQPAPGSVIVPEERGFLDNVLDIFQNPVRGINTILSFIGVPLFRSVSGGSDAQQQREIGIADLQVKVAQVERERAEMANKLREEVMLAVLDFEQTRREFQGQQEISRRSILRNEVLTLNYRFVADSLTTPQYLQELNSLDGQHLQTFRNWARLRTQLTRIKILVLGAEGF